MNENRTPTPTQLTLLPSSEAPVRSRLSETTRRRGLRHVAEIRQQLAARQATRPDDERPTARAPIRPTAA